jgi:hypothetical protein
MNHCANTLQAFGQIARDKVFDDRDFEFVAKLCVPLLYSFAFDS